MVELLFTHYSSTKELQRVAERSRQCAILHHLTTMTSQLSVLEGHHKVTASTLKTLSTVLKKQQQDYTELRSQHKALQQQLQETRAEADAASKHASAAARDKAAPTKLDVSCEPRSAQAVSDKAEPRADAASTADMPTMSRIPGHSEYGTPATTPQHQSDTQQASTSPSIVNPSGRQHAASASQHTVTGYVVNASADSNWLTEDVHAAGATVQAGQDNVTMAAPAAHKALGSPSLLEIIKREIDSPQHSVHA